MNAVTTPATSKLAQVAKGRKKCAGPCHKTKAVKEFSRNPKTADGFQSLCKQCMAEKISEGHARKKAIREAQAELAAQQAAEEQELIPMASPDAAAEPMDKYTAFDHMLGRLRQFACHARGMSYMDERMEGHANDLELLVHDMTRHQKGIA